MKKRVKMLKLLCMYPGVIFKPLSKLARSIILASGTLAPITSFQSELGTTFPNMLQANHVIPKDQVYVRGIAQGPTGIGLKANYANTNLFNFKVIFQIKKNFFITILFLFFQFLLFFKKFFLINIQTKCIKIIVKLIIRDFKFYLFE